MSRQVDKKIEELSTRLANVLNIIAIKQVDFSLECKINPGTLSKALERGSFSEDIVDKIHDRYGVRKLYWEDGKEPIIEKNGTYVKSPMENTGNEVNSALRDLIEKNGRYQLVPTMILTDYEIVSKREVDERIRLQDQALTAKQDLIDQLKREIASLRSTQPVTVHPQQAQ